MNDQPDSVLTQVMNRVQGMIFRPGETLTTIAQEPGGLKEAFFPYAVILGAIPAIMALIGSLVARLLMARITGQNPGGTVAFAAGIALIGYVGGLLATLVIGLLMAWAAPLFGAKKSWVLSCRVLIYAATPVFVASVLSIIPVLGMLVPVLAFLWTFVLLYIGIGRILETKGTPQLLFTLAVPFLYLLTIIPITAFAYSHYRSHVPPTPMALSENAPEMTPQAAMAAMIDQRLKEKVASGEIKQSDVPAAKAEILKEMQQSLATTPAIDSSTYGANAPQ